MQIISNSDSLSPDERRLVESINVDSFERILGAFKSAGRPLKNAVDGGAGAGNTAELMLDHLSLGSQVDAFEPFVGNHRFFEGRAQGVVLHKKALAGETGVMRFQTGAQVPTSSTWGGGRLAGYSSGGRLADTGGDTEVEAARGDDCVIDPEAVEFVKLDLEGGEVEALKGMSKLQQHAHVLWVEYKGGDGLLDSLKKHDPLILDSEYLIFSPPTGDVLDLFEFASEVPMSSGRVAWQGFRRKPWADFPREFSEVQQRFKMIQTDVICVNQHALRSFVDALRSIV